MRQDWICDADAYIPERWEDDSPQVIINIPYETQHSHTSAFIGKGAKRNVYTIQCREKELYRSKFGAAGVTSNSL